MSLVSGLQAAFRELQRIPQTLCTHYDLSPLTIHVGCPHEQGDVESQNRHLKRRLEQRLILRGSRDFQSLEAYEAFVQEVVRKANASRQEKVVEELACMRPLPAGELADYREHEAVVSSQSLIRVKKIAYSVPSRLIGRRLRIRLHEAHLKVYLGAEHLFDLPRLRGDRGALVDFRHVVEPLLRKPGAFANYRHRQALYPGVEFRAAHDRLEADHGQRSGVIEYLQLLKLAADQGVEAVRELLPGFLERKGKWRVTQLRELLSPPERKIVELQTPEPSLADYDLLLEQEVAHVV